MKKEETNMGREGERLQLAIGSKSYQVSQVITSADV